VETPFDFPFAVAVKTGTSRIFTDNWAVAVTGGFTVAVWVGNFSGRPMRRVSGVTGAGPLLRRAVLRVAGRYDPGLLPSPAQAGAVRARICRLSGHRAGERCPAVDEWFLPGSEPPHQCSWHGPDGRVSWPAEYADWVAQNRVEEGGERREVGGAALAASAPGLEIVSPRDGDRYEIPPGIDPRYATVALRAVGAAEDEPVAWYVDGTRMDAGRWKLEAGGHLVRAVGATGRVAEARVVVR
jgi:penicillin-binding protein 1C